ncbi:zf-ccch type zinc finger protein [Moniliophthora roreri]|uniref:Uncharacterized protein n=1 Tax=Moniliophthora roreri TaxID=221103 RepID=A0A0W0F865_MONRR|nr:zf-ccch type zinc finger protein [Moniliophthora roreri]
MQLSIAASILFLLVCSVVAAPAPGPTPAPDPFAVPNVEVRQQCTRQQNREVIADALCP